LTKENKEFFDKNRELNRINQVMRERIQELE